MPKVEPNVSQGVGMLIQEKLEWVELLGGEGLACMISQQGASIMDIEWAGRVSMQDRARLILTREAAAARRRRQAVPEYMRWEREEPPENAVALT